MSHQCELENSKYRNWVRGGLAYKYLKEGIKGFADDVVQQEHTRILSAVIHTSGLTCNQCCFRNLRPLHQCDTVPNTGRKRCPWGQNNCNCLYPSKQPCPNKICDAVMEEILKSHGSTPPKPNWNNTDIQKWCSSPWEIAKCFINAPGYSVKNNAADIDASGLLRVFINNTSLHAHLSCKMTGCDIFDKTLQRRNKIFHSPTMELEDTELDECIDDIIAILEDDKELKALPDAQQAVCRLKQLMQDDFIITTHSEAEVCRSALESITNKSVELQQLIENAKNDIYRKHTEATEAINDQTQKALTGATEELDRTTLHDDRIRQLELDNTVIQHDIILIKQHLAKIQRGKDHYLEKIFRPHISAAGILQLSSLLKRICASWPLLLPVISQLISGVVHRDESIVRYRISQRKQMNKSLPYQIQHLISDCLSVCDSDNKQMVTLSDVVIDESTETTFLHRIIPDNVLSLYVRLLTDGEEVWRWIERLNCLQYIFISINGLSHSKMALLLSLIEETPCRNLVLVGVNCTNSDCNGHEVNLSKQDQLQRLDLVRCSHVKIPDINPTNLEILRLVSTSENVLAIDCLGSARYLKELYLEGSSSKDVKYHTELNSVVQTFHQLQKLSLRGADIDENVLFVTTGMRNLSHIELYRVRVSLETWRRFVDSAHSLNQSLLVDMCFFLNEMDEEDARDYVRQNKTVFEVISEDEYEMSFRTKK